MSSTGLYVATAIAALLFLIPFYLIVRNALMTDPEITGENWKWFPTSIQWGNLTEPFDDTTVDFARSMWNSVVVAVLHTVGILLVCSLVEATDSPVSPTSTPTRCSTPSWPP